MNIFNEQTWGSQNRKTWPFYVKTLPKKIGGLKWVHHLKNESEFESGIKSTSMIGNNIHLQNILYSFYYIWYGIYIYTYILYAIYFIIYIYTHTQYSIIPMHYASMYFSNYVYIYISSYIYIYTYIHLYIYIYIDNIYIYRHKIIHMYVPSHIPSLRRRKSAAVWPRPLAPWPRASAPQNLRGNAENDGRLASKLRL